MKRLRVLIPLPLALVFLALAGCGGGASKLDSGDVAVVGSDHITQAMFAAALAEQKASLATSGGKLPAPGSTAYQAMKTNLVNLLVQRAELALEAKKLGITVSDTAVQKKIDAIVKSKFKGNAKTYAAAVKQQGFTDAQVRGVISEGLLEAKVFAAITKGSAPAQSAIDAYYQINQSQYQQPTSRKVQEILVGKNKKALADQIYDQLKGGADFAALAKKYSQDPGSKDQGGNFTAKQGSDVAEFDSAVFDPKAKTGVLLKPVNSAQYGWFVIKPIADITQGTQTPESKVEKKIRATLQGQQAQKLASAWMQRVAKSYCSGKIRYQSGYAPNPDPCATLAAPDQTTT
jgi:parvulin-like peptidyl-prolyl isomerase